MAYCIPSSDGRLIAHLNDVGDEMIGMPDSIESAETFLQELRRSAWFGNGAADAPFYSACADLYLRWANSPSDALERAAETRARTKAELQAPEAF